eukprot:TRINITY_DN30411_c0_g2_i1.p1 TRINITY_DN30411_c0_g2~~TRINITY_DN30411_c0_g2_i1.p1  ORF type:complete len:449 (-),score=137.89 TRINITY_DN30411_c0_g2_i1:205-1551(-)
MRRRRPVVTAAAAAAASISLLPCRASAYGYVGFYGYQAGYGDYAGGGAAFDYAGEDSNCERNDYGECVAPSADRGVDSAAASSAAPADEAEGEAVYGDYAPAAYQQYGSAYAYASDYAGDDSCEMNDYGVCIAPSVDKSDSAESDEGEEGGAGRALQGGGEEEEDDMDLTLSDPLYSDDGQEAELMDGLGDDTVAHLAFWNEGDNMPPDQREQAEAQCSAAMVSSPFLKGNELLQAGDYEGAMVQYKEAIQEDPFNAAPLVNMCSALARSGRFREAEGFCRRAVATQSDMGPAHLVLGQVWLHGGQKYEKRAFMELARATELAPEDTYVRKIFGMELRRTERLEEAAFHFRAVSRLQPSDMANLGYLSDVLERAGRMEEAAALDHAAVGGTQQQQRQQSRGTEEVEEEAMEEATDEEVVVLDETPEAGQDDYPAGYNYAAQYEYKAAD